jgi:aminopeptidase N
MPSDWIALANGKNISSVINGDDRVVEFSQTKPIPTYLFAFVAGQFEMLSKEKDGRVVSMLHKESDENRLSQSDEIFDLIFSSLEWLEDYTGIDYPFTKYDIAVIPGFQYGGMEHMGATFYADTRMFLEESATISDRMARAKLIAHETAHMWFGDYVTMKWFDDVWTKEVFANWFSSQIVSPLFPEIDHNLNFINSYFPASYAEDRTSGANAVRQNLANLNEAGLLYGNIIYNKAPIVMEKLVAKTGDSLFRAGMQRYLTRYAYSNATWDDLIEILDGLVEEDLRNWSDFWIKEPGMPVMDVFMTSEGVVEVEYMENTMGRNLSYGQDLYFDKLFVPESMVYGLINADSAIVSSIVGQLADFENIEDDDILYNVIHLYEMADAGSIERDIFIEVAEKLLCDDVNIIVFSRVAGYLNSYVFRGMEYEIEEMLLNIVRNSSDRERRIMAFNTYRDISVSERASDFLYSVWRDPSGFPKVPLGERDLMNLSYKLALLEPDRYSEIMGVQLERIGDEERRKEFKRTITAASPDTAVRDSIFISLLEAENRGNEPLALRSLALLNDKIVEAHALKYLEKGLGVIEEIHYTGDIFFPARWLGALLRGHTSEEASIIVADFLKNNRDDLNPLLKQKILQQSHHLFR